MAHKIVTKSGQQVQNFEDWKKGEKPSGAIQVVSRSGQTVQSFEEWKSQQSNSADNLLDESRRSVVADWANRYNAVMKGVSDYDTQRNGKFTRDASGGFGTEIESLIKEFYDIGGSFSDFGYQNSNNYLFNLRRLQDSINQINEIFSQFEDEEEYGRYLEYLKDRDEKRNLDLDAYNREIAALQQQLEDYDPQIDWTDTNQRKQYDAGLKELEDEINRRKQYLAQAQRIQKKDDFSAVANPESEKYDAAFDSKSGYVSTERDGKLQRMLSQYSMGYDDLTYEYINNQNGIRDEIKHEVSAYSKGETPFEAKGYDYMTEDEVGLYNYYYSMGGKASAEAYLETIQEDLNQRKAMGMYQQMEGKTGAEMVFGVEAGLDQFKGGIKGAVRAVKGDERYVALSAHQYASQMVREDLAEDGVKLPSWLGGASLGQVGYDAITTTANMAPSIAVGMLNPTLGTAALGVSAGGNAYQEALNEGYSVDQARGYGILSGASEIIMEKLLGGISAYGGNALGKFFIQNMKNADTALKRIAKEIGGSMLSEFSEEYLQEVLTPVFRNLTLGTDEEVKLFSAEALYAGFLGAITGGIMEGPQAIANVRNATDTPDMATELASSEEKPTGHTEVTRSATEGVTTEKSSAVDDKLLATEEDAENATTSVGVSKMETVQMTEDIESFAQQFGTQADAVRQNYMEGQDLQEYEVGFQAAYAMGLEGGKEESMEKNVPYLSQSQRDIAYSLGRDAAAAQKAVAESKKKPAATAQLAGENGPDDVAIAEILSMDNNNMTFRLEDGRTVTDADLSFNKGQQVLATVWDLGMDIKSANAILQESAANTSEDAHQAAGIEEAYRYGAHGYSMEQLTQRGTESGVLTDSQRLAAWNAGQISRQQAALSPAAPKVSATSGVYFDAGSGNVAAISDDLIAGASDAAKAGVKAAQVLQKLGIGKSFYFFESYVNDKGERVYKDENGIERRAPNGWYDKSDGSIHIDLNAGGDANGLTLYTLSHELTHFVEKWSPKKYQVLADFLVENYSKGASVDELVVAKQADLSENRGTEVSYDEAYSEFIADSMEAMLADGNVLEKLTEMKAKDRSLFEKIREFFDNLAKKIREIYKNLTPDSDQSKAVLEMKDQIEQIQQLFAEALADAGENFQAADGQKNARDGRQFSDRKESKKRITMSMTDSERTEILKDKVITAEVYGGQADKAITDSRQDLESHKDTLIKSALVKIGEEFGVFTDYSISDVEIDIRLSKGNLKESISKKIDPIQIAKLLPVLKTAVENAVGIECHANRYFHDNNTVMFENMIGGYVDGEYFVPVRFGLKHSIAGKATVYLIVDQQKIEIKKIKAEVAKATVMQKHQADNTSRSAFNISLASIVPFVNGKDLLRYLPDDMLTPYQRDAKWEAIAETIIYTNSKNDRHYTNCIREGNLVGAKQMVKQAAKVAGYTINLHHGTAGDPFYVFRLGAEGIHLGTLAQATQRVNATKERLQYELRSYTDEEIRKNLSSIPQAARRCIVEDVVSGTDALTDVEVTEGYELADGSRSITDAELLSYLNKSARNTYRLPNGIMGINIDERIIDAYVKAEHPVVFDVDIGEWTAYNIADILIHKIKGQKVEIYSLDNHDWVDYDPAGITGIDLTDADIPELERISQEREFSAIAEFLQSKGADSVQYLNTYEGSKNEESYILLSPEQVKLADAITYDDNGNIVPISQRFNPENKDIRYQDRSAGTSNRALLAGAFEELVTSPDELKFIREYQENVGKLNEQEAKLQEIRTEIREISFGKGPRDTKRLQQLQEEAAKTANRIDIYDKKLLQLERAKPLRDVLDREREKVRKRTRQKGQEALENYREKRKESAAKKDARRKIRKTIMDLNKLLNRGDKKKHVKDGVTAMVGKSLKLAEALFMDEYSNRDMLRNGLSTQLTDAEEAAFRDAQQLLERIESGAALEGKDFASEMEAQDYLKKLDGQLSGKMAKLKDAFARERKLLYGTTVSDLLGQLADEYNRLSEAEDGAVRAAKDENVYAHLLQLKKDVGGTTVRDMTLSQMEQVADAFTMVLTTVRNANKLFAKNLNFKRDTLAAMVMGEIRSAAKKKGILEKPWEHAKDSFFWNNLKPVYAFSRLGSETLRTLYQNIRKGQDTWAVDMQEADAFRREQYRKHKRKGWDLEKQHSFEFESGKVQLSLEQIMSLYAYSRREQALDHLLKGGFVFSGSTEVIETKNGIKRRYLKKDSTAYNLTADELLQVIDTLSAEQKAFVEEMQTYLSDVMGGKGNEVSLQMYGIKSFGEKNYFPIRSAGQYMEKAKEDSFRKEQGQISIVNSGFTKSVAPKANNPITLDGFMNVWAEHVNDMAMYHGFVLPMEDFRRVYNYSSPNVEEGKSQSVNATIENAHGEAATTYIDQLYKDLNGGAVSDNRENLSKKLVGLHKKAAVFASASVVIQQLSAIVRAFAVIDAKYFRGPKVDHKRHKLLWAELKQYAPVAFVKEMGYFDTGMGRSAKDFLQAEEYSGIREKAKALFKDSDYRDEILGKAPALADELAWCSIWEAVKRETVARNPKMNPRSEAFLQIAGERFAEVIDKTQVYDSVLSRSANMRSKALHMNMLTSFLAEPTTSINMLEDALRKGDKRQIRRTVGAVYGSVLLNSLLVSLVYAARDDDEDETYWEKYLSSVAVEMVDGLNPLTYYPFLRDVWSIGQGFDVERADMSLISDFTNAAKKVISAGVKLRNATEPEEAAALVEFQGSLWSMVDSVASLTGLPMKNIRRDIEGARNLVRTINADLNARDTTKLSLMDAVLSNVMNSIPFGGLLYSKSKRDRLYGAMVAGDAAYVQRLKAGYESDSAYHSAVRLALRDNDSRIWEAAVAWNAGDMATYIRLAKEIRGENRFDQDDIVLAIRAEASAMEEDDSTASSKAKWYFTNEKFGVAMRQNNTAMADTIQQDLIDTAVANGKTQAEAKDSVQSTARTQLKNLFMEGTVTGTNAEKMLVRYGGYDKKNAAEKVAEWQYEKDYPELDGRITYSQYKRWETDGKSRGLSLDTFTSVVEFRDGDTSSGVRSQDEVAAYINGLPIPTDQKDALWCCFWSESTLYKSAPWH